LSEYSFIEKLTPVDKALSVILPKLNIKPDCINCNIVEAVGKISAETVISPLDFPPYNRSAVDGFAVRAEDTYGASPSNPVILMVKGFLGVSDTPDKYSISPGECVEVATGAPIPQGANAVIMAEYVRKVTADKVEIYTQVPPLANVSLKGEDLRKGDVIVRQGEKIRPWHVGLLATANIHTIRVFREIRAVVLGIGDELIPLGEKLQPGKIVSSTTYMVASFLQEKGVKVTCIKVLPDDLELIKKNVIDALKQADMVITTGGTSVGLRDYTIRAVKSLNPDVIVHGLAIKPGKPTGLAVKNGKLILMLSGYPVAALTGLIALFDRIIYHIYGTRPQPKPRVKGRLTRRVYVEPGVRGYVRVKVYERDGEIEVEPLMLTGSGILSTLIKGNGLLVVPEELEGFDEGDLVEVELLSHILVKDQK